MKIVTIIQARMGSTRLPGKVMKTILEKPVILWDIDRILRSRLIDEIVVAVPFNRANDIIVDTVRHYNDRIIITRGKEDDVLDRYYRAAKETGADVVVRITSDCPLIDPVVTDKVIEKFLNSGCDYCSNTIERTYPRGLDSEVFSFEALEKAWTEAKMDYEREHVTPYILENPDKFKLINVSNDIDLSQHRWTLDTKEDFKFIDTVYRRIYPQKQDFLMSDILGLLKRNPELIDINKHIMQKKTH